MFSENGGDLIGGVCSWNASYRVFQLFWDPEPTPMTTSKKGTLSGPGLTWFIVSQVPETNRECHLKLHPSGAKLHSIEGERARLGRSGWRPRQPLFQAWDWVHLVARRALVPTPQLNGR